MKLQEKSNFIILKDLNEITILFTNILKEINNILPKKYVATCMWLLQVHLENGVMKNDLTNNKVVVTVPLATKLKLEALYLSEFFCKIDWQYIFQQTI